ncbi:MAG: hypothetical protein IKW59_08695 [Clostridia bacterium]|nr:hypothetical protein [Clostridia bacterium]
MAQLDIINVTYKEFTIEVTDLQYTGDNYDKFVFKIYQGSRKIIEWVESDTSWITTVNFTFEFSNSVYAGYNWLSPNNTYVAEVTCYYDGVGYTLNNVTFSTDSISPPTGTITPSVYVPIRNQVYGSCVANCLACGMEIFKAKQTGIKYEKFSEAYIFGSDGTNYDYMTFEEAVDNCITYGSPRYEIYSGFYPDEMPKATAVNMFNSADSIVNTNAQKQKLRNKRHIDFYDCSSVKSCIETYGFYMLNFRIPNNFQTNSSGIIPQPTTYRGDNHAIALIGLTQISGKAYWIAQNSWGEDWGLNGRCYIPYDWGCGCQSPITSDYGEPTSWTLDCYSVAPGSGYTDSNPTKPYNIKVQQIETEKNVSISWDCSTSSCNFVILAKQYNTNRWYRKAYTSNKNAIISLDTYGTYDFAVIAIYNGYCSEISDTERVSTSENKRPDNYYWSYEKRQNEEIKLTASEWNGLTSRINEFRQYTSNGSLGNYNFDTAIDGNDFTAVMYNQCREAMQDMEYGSYIPYVYKSEDVTAYMINVLISELNVIP